MLYISTLQFASPLISSETSWQNAFDTLGFTPKDVPPKRMANLLSEDGNHLISRDEFHELLRSSAPLGGGREAIWRRGCCLLDGFLMVSSHFE